MNLKKTILGLTASGLLLGTVFSAIGQTNNNEAHRYLPSILDLVLNSNPTCVTPSELTSSATANGNEGDNVPSRALDNLLSTRWSSNSNPIQRGGIITFELASTSIVTDIDIAWFRSDERTSNYSIERSIDNVTWVEIVAPTNSVISDETEFQSNDVEDAQANYIRIIGTGNTDNEFTSISEVIINGCINSSSSSSSSDSVPPGGNEPVEFGTGVTITTFNNSSTSSSGGNIDFDLDPNLEPWENFDLSIWGLDSPANRNTSANVPSGQAPRGVRIDDFEFIALREGPSNSNYNSALALYEGTSSTVESTEPYFFTGADGGMVFMSPVGGARTSANTSFPRSELREYSRAGVRERLDGSDISVSGVNENNWVLGYQPENLIFDDNNDNGNDVENVGGRNGRLAASLRVNRVTTTGADDDVGVTIIGQIHAQNDEPIRLYYRKLPNRDLGSVYVVHEIRRAQSFDNPNDGRFGRDYPDINLVGSSSDSASASAVADGIALDELFSYEIINEDNLLIVNLYRGALDGQPLASTTINMSTIVNQRSGAAGDPAGSGYDRPEEWMYFKAGAYTQNNTGDDDDYDLVTFYQLDVSHDVNVIPPE